MGYKIFTLYIEVTTWDEALSICIKCWRMAPKERKDSKNKPKVKKEHKIKIYFVWLNQVIETKFSS